MRSSVRRFIRSIDRWFGFHNVRGHTIYAPSLDESATVLDLGANRGKFAWKLASDFGCKVVCIEASPDLHASIPTSDRVATLQFAVGESDGYVRFYPSTNPEAGTIVGPKANSSGNPIEVPAVSLATLMRRFKEPVLDLVKVDIEGAEIAVFGSATKDDLDRIAQLSVEFHDSILLANVSTIQVEKIINKLKVAGLAGYPMGRRNLDWWFYNPAHLRLSLATRLYLWLRQALRIIVW